MAQWRKPRAPDHVAQLLQSVTLPPDLRRRCLGAVDAGGNTQACARSAHAAHALDVHWMQSASHCASVIGGLCTGPCVAKTAQFPP